MDVRELRYGNWISINYGTKEKIDIVERKAVMSDLMVAEMLDPIPLSEEWLIKFGFESEKVYEVVFEYTIDKKHRIQTDGEMYILMGYKDGIEIKYVHQLQNLYFALTGEELTIKE